MRKKLFLHIGFPKTATTVLQSKVFPQLEDVYFMGKNEALAVEYKQPLSRTFFTDVVNLNSEEFSKKYEDYYLDFPDVKSTLISEELILFNMFRPIAWLENKRPSATSIARNLSFAFPKEIYDVKVIISIREQFSLLQSIYAQSYTHCYSKYDKTNTFVKFLTEMENKNSDFYMMDCLNFKELRKVFEVEFGLGNVILPYYEQEGINHFIDEITLFISNKKYNFIDLAKINNRQVGVSTRVAHPDNLRTYLSRLKHKTPLIRNLKFPGYLKKIAEKLILKKELYIDVACASDVEKQLKEKFIKLR